MIPWNKGLTKDTDSRVAAYGKKVSKTTKSKAIRCSIDGCDNKRSGNNLKCKVCRKSLKLYGLTSVDREKLLDSQNGLCLICRRKIRFIGAQGHTTESAVVDHCHETNKVRGILCHRCNTMLSVIEDFSIKVERIKEYLAPL